MLQVPLSRHNRDAVRGILIMSAAAIPAQIMRLCGALTPKPGMELGWNIAAGILDTALVLSGGLLLYNAWRTRA